MNPSADNAVHLAHFSDIHVTCRPLGWQMEDWFNKRLPAWMNLRLLGRAYRFRRAEEVVKALTAEFKQRRPNHLIFSGDATALGFESEVKHAAGLLGLHNGDVPPGMAVPGNHDYCTPTAAEGGGFEKHFARWQFGERVDDSVYPFAQRVGPVWLVAANTSTANRLPWDAGGAIDALQLNRLARLLARLPGGPRILVTHYPVCLKSGKPESRSHGLRNVEELVRVAEAGKIRLWLHGHRHGPYRHECTALSSFPVICAGSATQCGLWSYGEYRILDGVLEGVWRVYDPLTGAFCDGESFELRLTGGSQAVLG
jgi:3',5'-cyclic AMP phosphodiesterase CpdA